MVGRTISHYRGVWQLGSGGRGSWRPEALRGFGIKLGQSAVPGVVQVMLARSYAASGRTADARKAYEAAFDLWPDAEPDMPLLVEAKREYAALGS